MSLVYALLGAFGGLIGSYIKKSSLNKIKVLTMKKYSTIKSVVIGLIIASVLAFLLPDIPLSDILAIIIIMLGGFIATYISITNEARIGLYEGLLYVLSTLPILLISKSGLGLYSLLILVSIPILAFIGGFIAKQLRSRLEVGDEKITN